MASVERAGRLGVGGQRARARRRGGGGGLAGLVDPLVVESRAAARPSQRSTASCSRPSRTRRSNSRASTNTPSPTSPTMSRVATRTPSPAARERAPDRDELGSQALARARVEHLGPEAAGDLRARVHARMQGQPAEQRARPPTLGHGQCDAVRLERQGAEEAHSEHDERLSAVDRAAPAQAFAFVWRSCGARVSGSRRKRQAEVDGMAATADTTERRVRARGHAARGVLVWVLCPAGSARTPTAVRATRSTPTTSTAERSAASTSAA